MEPNELRVGNLLSYGAHGTATVIDIKGSGKIKIHIHSKQSNEKGYIKPTVHVLYLDPIPLTLEWLGKMGFVKNTREEWDGPKIELEHSLEWFTIKGYGPSSFMLMGSEWTMGKPFQYVHQLQNLYFAVTGEELIINP